MKSLILLATAIVLSNASTLQIKTIPSTISIPKEVEDFSLSTIPKLNNYFLGLSTEIDEQFTGVTGDMFSRPKALAVVEIKGIDNIGGKSVEEYQSTDNSYVDFSSTKSTIESVFGEGSQYVQLDGTITGGSLADSIKSFAVPEDSVKTKIPTLRQELLDLKKIIGYLEKNGPRLDVSSPEFFNIRINGLVNAVGTETEIAEAKVEVQKILEKLTEVLKSVYGDQVVVEVITTNGNEENLQNHVIAKRDAQPKENGDIKEIRKKYNVYSFTQGDYPAIFAIFAGVSIILAIAILFIAVGMWTMDPGKDSIIYRMTTTKLKKD